MLLPVIPPRLTGETSIKAAGQADHTDLSSHRDGTVDSIGSVSVP